MAAYAAQPPLALPADVRLMQATANAVFAVAGLALCAAAALWVTRLPAFAVKAIRVEGEVSRNSASTIRANAAPKLAGNFLTLDLQRTREAFEAVPWVRHAVVRRVWPNRLAVQLEEHRPAALWGADDGNDKLVNSFGEVFEANTGDVDELGLTTLTGPDGTSAQMLAMLRRLQPLLAPLNAGDIEHLALSARGSWQVTFDGGAVVELGRGSDDDVVARAQHFVRAMPRVIATYQRPLASADLRHAEGFAVRLQGLGTAVPVAPARKP
jgi:cell division protein FtsQ